MRRMIVLAAMMGVGGCATLGIKSKSTTVDDSKLVRLPQQDKQQILNAQKRIDVAQSNVTAAKVANNEANQFCKVADSELDAAKAKEKAADQAMKLGRSAQSNATFGAGQKQAQEAEQERLAAQANKQYCNVLVEARRARLKEADASVTATKADTELVKLRMLQKNDLASGIDENPFLDAKRKADEAVARDRLDVAQREGEMNAVRATWLQRSQASQRAQRDIGVSPIPAPPPPKLMPAGQSATPTNEAAPNTQPTPDAQSAPNDNP